MYVITRTAMRYEHNEEISYMQNSFVFDNTTRIVETVEKNKHIQNGLLDKNVAPL